MKHDELRSMAHNIADSLACGMGFLIGIYGTDIFEEARISPEGYITVDFLNGTTQGGVPSASLAKAIHLYRDALPGLCEKHSASISLFRKLTARYSVDIIDGRDPLENQRVLIEMEDQKGRHSTDEYIGAPLKHIKKTTSCAV